MLGYIGTNELLIIGAILIAGLIPIAAVIFLVVRKPQHVANQAQKIADLREEVGRLREQVARGEDLRASDNVASYGVAEDVSTGRVRIGQR